MIENNSNCPKQHGGPGREEVPREEAAKDPWGKDFILKCPGTNDTDGADISSSGPDKQEGTADDIKSWEYERRRATAR